ncbi:MAG: polyprenyl synthetase family protein [Ruminococcaceae bacterium]|nr:polyprenyl synthetase family protein [Oscillospiraceae bacterium]
MDIAKLLAENSEKIDVYLEKYLQTDEKELETLYEAMRYSTLSGGKRIRPFLVMEFCRLFGGCEEAAIPFACAIEYVHTSSLIHDDMPCMDNDALRRGRPTNHVVFGEDIALLAGDALITRGYEMAARNAEVEPSTALAATAMLLYHAGAVGMMGGQEIDLLSEGKKTDFSTLMKMHEKKTGALIRAACLLGVMAAGITDERDERYNAAVKYARGVGLTFQIIDDILDVEGDAALLGKATHADAALEKTTFLSFMSIDEAKDYAKKLTEEAIAAIAPFDGNEALTELAKFLLTRKK